LARRAEAEYPDGRDFAAIELCYVTQMPHACEVPLCDRYGVRQYLACPERFDSEKRSGIGERTYAVEQAAHRQTGDWAFFVYH
jgi:hypothetical protein